jgi:hypothetical protein
MPTQAGPGAPPKTVPVWFYIAYGGAMVPWFPAVGDVFTSPQFSNHSGTQPAGTYTITAVQQIPFGSVGGFTPVLGSGIWAPYVVATGPSGSVSIATNYIFNGIWTLVSSPQGPADKWLSWPNNLFAQAGIVNP